MGGPKTWSGHQSNYARLPLELFNLTSLTTLAYHNELTDDIPDLTIGNLSILEVLHM